MCGGSSWPVAQAGACVVDRAPAKATPHFSLLLGPPWLTVCRLFFLLPTKGLPRIEQRNIRFSSRPASVLGCSEETLNSVSEVPCSWLFSVEGGSWLRKEGSDRMAQILICGSGGHCRKQHLNHCPLFRVWLSWQASAGSASCHHAAVAEFWGWSN